MVHPVRFDPDDPLLHRLRRICLALPEAAETVSHGRPTFYTAKVFAIFGGVLKGEHVSNRYSRSVVVLPDPDEGRALLQEEGSFLPAYLGPSGWVGVDLSEPDTDWQQIGEIIEMSYRNTATKRLVRALDELPG